MNKKERLNKIKEVIEEFEINTQEELTEKLNSYGLNVSQATVSRDINELNLIKVDGLTKKTKYFYVNNLATEIPEKIKNLFKTITLSITVANNLIVIKTIVGNGSSVGMAVDSMHIPQIIGSVSGDDTLLIVAKNNDDAIIVNNILRSINAQ